MGIDFIDKADIQAVKALVRAGVPIDEAIRRVLAAADLEAGGQQNIMEVRDETQ